jgi:hypothetical protein
MARFVVYDLANPDVYVWMRNADPLPPEHPAIPDPFGEAFAARYGCGAASGAYGLTGWGPACFVSSGAFSAALFWETALRLEEAMRAVLPPRPDTN